MDSENLLSADELGESAFSSERISRGLSKLAVFVVFAFATIIVSVSIALPVYYSVAPDSGPGPGPVVDLPPYDVNHTCSSNSDCISTYCLDESCTYIEGGQPCINNTMCYSDLCIVYEGHEGKICAALPAHYPCNFDQACFFPITCVNNLCRGAPIGGPCSEDGLCQNNNCNSSHVCDVADIGQYCELNSDCFTNICNVTSNECLSQPAGSWCDSNAWYCSYCLENTCRGNYGDPCVHDNECPNYHCVDSYCGSKLPGQLCNTTMECYGISCTDDECIGANRGEPCYDDFSCNSLDCQGTFPEAYCGPSPAGRPCDSSFDCISNSCVDEVCAL